MNNPLYTQIKENFKNKEKSTLNTIKKWVNDEQLKTLLMIVESKDDVMYSNDEYKRVEKNDCQKSYDNGYDNGLCAGAESQNDYTICSILKRFLWEFNSEAPESFLIKEIRYLSFVKEVIEWLGFEKDIKILTVNEKCVLFDGEGVQEIYYIYARKNTSDKEFDFMLIEYTDITLDYEPSQEELEKIQDEYKKIIQ